MEEMFAAYCVTAAAAERLEAQNRHLREYLHERRAFLARVKSLIADIQAEDRQLRERFADVLPLISDPAIHRSS